MTTSGSANFDLDVAELIEEAYERCGLEVRTGYDGKTARRSLNLMFAEWANRGLNLWTVEQGSFTVTADQEYEELIPGMAGILEVVVRRDGTDYEVERLGRNEFALLPSKTTTGRPSQFWFNRLRTPRLYMWPRPENSTDTIIYYYVRRIEDADALTNTTDVPWRFYPCMVAGLAYYLAMKKAPDRLQLLKGVYEEEFMRAADEDEERASLKLQPSAQYLRF